MTGDASATGRSHRLRCRCGRLQGWVEPARSTRRAVCYCRDCQTYARVLGVPGVVDDAGGTEVVATLPRHVRFTDGTEHLAALSLRDGGLLRWYASCCRTPIANTPRDARIAYVGLVHSALESGGPPLPLSFGASRMVVNTGGARRPVRATPWRNAIGIAALMRTLLAARLGGGWRRNPFFDGPDGRQPVRPVRVLGDAERAAARAAIGDAPPADAGRTGGP